MLRVPCMPLAEIGSLARKRGILFMVDGAQAAGSHVLDISGMNIGMLAVPDIKDFLALWERACYM